MTHEKIETGEARVDERLEKLNPELPKAGTELAPSEAERARKEREVLDAVLEKEVGMSMAQLIVLEELAKGISVSEAARRAEVHNGTIYRWMHHHPAFMKQHQSLKHNLHAAAESRLVGMLDRALDAVDGQIERGDGRLGLDLLREMKVTARSKESSSTSPEAGHCETVVEMVHERVSVSTGGSGEIGDRRKQIEEKA